MTSGSEQPTAASLAPGRNDTEGETPAKNAPANKTAKDVPAKKAAATK